jgi:hypothetical protein
VSLKTKVDDLSVIWHQNHWDDFLRFGLKTSGDGFSSLASKPTAMVSLVWPQNQGGGGFPGLGLKIGNYGLMI